MNQEDIVNAIAMDEVESVVKEFERLRAALAKVEAERDEALKAVEKIKNERRIL